MFLQPPLGPQLDQLPGLSHRLHLKPSATRDKSPRTPLHRLWIHFLHTVHWTVCLYSFPTDTTGPLSRVYNHLPTTAANHHLDFPAFTFNPLSSRLALQSATRLPSCSIVGAIITRSSAYSNSEGRPLLASLETTSMTAVNNSGLSTDPWCKPTFTSKLSLSPASVLTTVQASVYNIEL